MNIIATSIPGRIDSGGFNDDDNDDETKKKKEERSAEIDKLSPGHRGLSLVAPAGW